MSEEKERARGIKWGKILWLFTVLLLLAAAGVYWWAKHYLYAGEIAATRLSAHEQTELDRKLQYLELKEPVNRQPVPGIDGKPLAPEPYSETAASRELVFSERELNALISRDPQLARHMAIALSPDLVSVTALIPIDPEFPILGGKTLRVRLGVELAYKAGAPVVALRGVSLGGIPLPKAWLGDLKYKNLVKEFGESGGFWQTFAAGIEGLQVGEGRLQVRLRE